MRKVVDKKESLEDMCKQHWRKLGIKNAHDLRKYIKNIFEEQQDQVVAFIEIYKIALPDWDKFKQIDGYPQAGEELAKFISKEFMAFDQKYNPDYFAGGLWMNKGFSINRNLKPW